MYRDNTLIPSEAVRMLALGLLAGRPMSYAQLAREVRHFTGRIMGPSLDLVGAPLEVLKVEGLVENLGGVPDARDHDDPESDQQALTVTPEGRDLNKLIVALKMRFLHQMDPADRRIQAELLHDICERELARLCDLRSYHGEEPGHLCDWLDSEIVQTRARLEWFARLRDGLA
jgi:hypothetical protein